jgi:D-alanyl-D-alanine carboxypeptidase/D-alanyl-D-alanine-endopeptidase (penicillin-binding protein 4)
MKKFSLLALIFAITLQPLCAQTKSAKMPKLNELKEYVAELKTGDKDLTNTVWSVAVADAKTGQKLFDFNSNYSLLPASNLKLVTTGIGLFLLGSDYTFKTKLAYTGNISDSVLYGNLYIIGGGDPSLGSSIYSNTVPDSVFLKWTNAVKNLGIKQIAGRIVGDTRFFDDQIRYGSWELDDFGTDYGAGVSGIQFMDNLCKVYIQSAASLDKKPSILRVVPYLPEVSWENYMTSADSANATGVDIYMWDYSNRALLYGKVRANSRTRTLSAAIPNTAYTCVWYFNKYLNNNGITTSNRVEVMERRIPDFERQQKTVFYTYNSPVYTEIIHETNKSSNNCFAETILKTIGAEIGGDGSISEGRDIVEKKLEELQVNTDGFRQADGSGLARQDFVTTNFMCNFLSMMYNRPEFPNFIQSLPIAGVDGTMSDMLKGTAAEGNVKAKSGSLGSVRSYSGYVTTKSGVDLCFSFIFNNYTCRTSEITKKIEKMMVILAEAK